MTFGGWSGLNSWWVGGGVCCPEPLINSCVFQFVWGSIISLHYVTMLHVIRLNDQVRID